MMDDERPALPEGWQTIALQDLVEIKKGKKPPIFEEAQAGLLPYVDIEAFEYGRFKKFAHPSEGVPITESDILIVWDGARSGLVGAGIRGVLGSTLAALRPKQNLHKDYLRYFLQSHYSDLNTNTRGIGIPHIEPNYLRSMAVPLPPLLEQERIVAAIETQFTRLEAGVAALRRVQVALKRYKAAVLKAACEGRLVGGETPPQQETDESAEALLTRILAERRARWESAHPGKQYVPPAAPDTASLPALPSGWCWTNIGNLFEVSVGGTPSRKVVEYWEGDIYWVSSGEVAFNRIRNTREKITRLGLDNSSTKLNPPGTVLLAMIGEGKTRGQAAILEVPAANNQNVAAILCSGTLIKPEWVFFWFMATYEQTRQGGVASGAMQPALNSAKVQALPIPLPPLAEQHRIVAEVERRLSVVAETEAAVKAGLARAARLRQAILREAFAGRLV